MLVYPPYKPRRLHEPKKLKLHSTWHCVGKRTEIVQLVLKIQYVSLLPKCVKYFFRGLTKRPSCRGRQAVTVNFKLGHIKIKRYLARRIVMNGKQRKATCSQMQENCQ